MTPPTCRPVEAFGGARDDPSPAGRLKDVRARARAFRAQFARA